MYWTCCTCSTCSPSFAFTFTWSKAYSWKYLKYFLFYFSNTNFPCWLLRASFSKYYEKFSKKARFQNLWLILMLLKLLLYKILPLAKLELKLLHSRLGKFTILKRDNTKKTHFQKLKNRLNRKNWKCLKPNWLIFP